MISFMNKTEFLLCYFSVFSSIPMSDTYPFGHDTSFISYMAQKLTEYISWNVEMNVTKYHTLRFLYRISYKYSK